MPKTNYVKVNDKVFMLNGKDPLAYIDLTDPELASTAVVATGVTTYKGKPYHFRRYNAFTNAPDLAGEHNTAKPGASSKS